MRCATKWKYSCAVFLKIKSLFYKVGRKGIIFMKNPCNWKLCTILENSRRIYGCRMYVFIQHQMSPKEKNGIFFHKKMPNHKNTFAIFYATTSLVDFIN